MARSKATFTIRRTLRMFPSYFSLKKGITFGNRVTLLKNGSRAFPAMLDAIDRAQSTIHLEIYILRSDETGWTFAKHLAAQAQKGVAVNLHYDGFGSFGAESAFFHFLEKAGVRLLEYHPLLPWRRPHRSHFGWLKRNHRKMLILDRQIAFIGGLNIGNEYAGEKGWRDTLIRIEGPAVRYMEHLFLQTWKRHGGPLPTLGPHPHATSTDLFLEGDSAGQERAAEEGDTINQEKPDPDVKGLMVQVIGNKEWKERHRIRKSFLKAVKTAKKNVYIAHAYFIPDRGIRRALRNAARRGVEVTILLPSVSDVPAITYACRALYTHYLSCGIRIFEWPHRVLHAKTITIDGIWSSVGSYNMDHRSLFHNLEVIVNIYGNAFGSRMNKMFHEDLSLSSEILLPQWEKRSHYQRILERFFYFFRYLL